LVLDTAGRKLSKQNRAPALDLRQAASIWLAALQFLGQEPPFRPGQASAGELRDWAIANWSLQKIPGVASKTLADAVVRDTDHAPT
jgi:glutamyl-Q tRNA(Asp) synthetase